MIGNKKSKKKGVESESILIFIAIEFNDSIFFVQCSANVPADALDVDQKYFSHGKISLFRKQQI